MSGNSQNIQNRLKSEDSSTRFGGLHRAYALDGAFNRTNLNGSNGATSFTSVQNSNGQNQTTLNSTTQNGVQTNISYTYDGEGNRAQKADGSSVLTYDYDSQQRLTAVNKYVNGSAAMPVLKCGYRCDGLRAWKEDAQGVRTYFLYNGDQMIGEVDSSGTMQAIQTWGAEGLASRRQLTGTSAGNKFYSWDPRGNIAATTDASGNILNTPLSDGFGSAGGTEPCATFGGQVGGYKDSETGLILFGQRYYDNSLGQWITRDPIGEEGGINLYSYVQGNPVNGLDPSGLSPVVAKLFNPWTDKENYFPHGNHGKKLLMPSEMDIYNNIEEAGQHYLNPLWFKSMVGYGAPWDYKVRNPVYEDFGNFHYGVVGYFAGFNEVTLLNEAGVAQLKQDAKTGAKPCPGEFRGRPNDIFGHGGIAPYGDHPEDQVMIKRGYAYAKAYDDQTNGRGIWNHTPPNFWNTW